jgi:hypothetical protein
MTKLHIGCGDIKLEGFINVDIRKTIATDIVSPAWDINGIDPGTVDIIYSRHTLEHLDPNDARVALIHWFELLKEDGYIHVVVPDIEFHAKQLLGLVRSGKFDDQIQHAYAGFWGWRDESRGGSKEDAHKWGYSEKMLFNELREAGFKASGRILEGRDSEPWHLNVISARSVEAIHKIQDI